MATTKWLSSFLLFTVAFLSAQAQDKVIDKAHAAQLKQVNVEMANRTAVLMADDPDALAEPSLAEQLYRMVFKRNAKKEGKEEKKEEDPKTTTPAAVDSSAKPEEVKHEKSHHKHKGHHKKHKHHHKHHQDNGTEVDWHSIG